MSGLEATGDPRDGSFRVTKATILDPLHPHGSKAWGPSPAPGAAIPVATVGRQLVPRNHRSRWNRLPGMQALAARWVLVVPADGPAPPNPAAGQAPPGGPPGAGPRSPAPSSLPLLPWVRSRYRLR